MLTVNVFAYIFRAYTESNGIPAVPMVTGVVGFGNTFNPLLASKLTIFVYDPPAVVLALILNIEPLNTLALAILFPPTLVIWNLTTGELPITSPSSLLINI